MLSQYYDNNDGGFVSLQRGNRSKKNTRRVI